MKQIVPWTLAALLVLPGAAILFSRAARQSQQNQKPQDQQQNPSPGAVSGHSTPPAKQGAQPQSQQGKPPRTLGAVSELVLVPVTVKNSAGQLVGDLRKDEFRIFDDGHEQQIARFSTDPVPLSAVIVLDNDLSLKERDQVQKSLESIAAALGPSDEAALMLFDEFRSRSWISRKTTTLSSRNSIAFVWARHFPAMRKDR